MPPISDLIELAVLLALAGGVAGFLAGLFGIGGGAVLVPVFYQAFALFGVDDGLRIKLSVGTSLAIIIPTSLRSFQSHYKKGAVDMALLRRWVIAIPLGAITSTLIIAYAPGSLLRGTFAVITLLIGLKMLVPRSSQWRLGEDLPQNPVLFFCGWLIGLLSGLIGIGGGTLNNTFMTLFNRPIHQAVATSAGVGVLISLPSFIGNIVGGWGKAGLPPFSTGYINWVAVILIIPITIMIAPLGATVAHKLSKRTLEAGFGIFLLIISARFFYSFF